MQNDFGSAIHQLQDARTKWWRKPLVIFRGRALPAELAILAIELSAGESGAWINSRGSLTGVVDLVASSLPGRYTTKRVQLPDFVSQTLKRVYQVAEVTHGCPDLVIWNEGLALVRLVEVKCPHWDRPTKEQDLFLKAAASVGLLAKVVEWEFRDSA